MLECKWFKRCLSMLCSPISRIIRLMWLFSYFHFFVLVNTSKWVKFVCSLFRYFFISFAIHSSEESMLKGNWKARAHPNSSSYCCLQQSLKSPSNILLLCFFLLLSWWRALPIGLFPAFSSFAPLIEDTRVAGQINNFELKSFVDYYFSYPISSSTVYQIFRTITAFLVQKSIQKNFNDTSTVFLQKNL